MTLINDVLTDEQIKRCEQIESFGKNYEYDKDSQENLIWSLYEFLLTKDWLEERRKKYSYLETIKWDVLRLLRTIIGDSLFERIYDYKQQYANSTSRRMY